MFGGRRHGDVLLLAATQVSSLANAIKFLECRKPNDAGATVPNV
jgi:hypothetical protein